MITKTANLYLLKEAGLGEDIQKKWDEFQKWRIANGYTAGNAASKLGIGSKALREELARTGLVNTVKTHGAKRLKELDELKRNLALKIHNVPNSVANWLTNGRYNQAVEGFQQNAQENYGLQEKYDALQKKYDSLKQHGKDLIGRLGEKSRNAMLATKNFRNMADRIGDIGNAYHDGTENFDTVIDAVERNF